MSELVIAHAPTILPNQNSPFIGRADEVAEILRLLNDPDCRLLTLIGVGGTGKTRLALEAVNQFYDAQESLLDADCMDVYFVPLQPLQSPDLIVTAIADAMHFSFYAEQSAKTQLFNFMADKPALLVLDNYEHLLVSATLVSEILAAAPLVKLIVTSRERLHLVEEWTLEVGGLEYPHHPHDAHPRDYPNFSAVQLFVQHARRARPGFTPDTEWESIIRICALVEGMPLALELAASWVRALSCSEIAGEIERGLDILETPARNIPARHRNMRVVIDQSWVMLTEAEANVFQRLSIFRGGFTRASVEAVAGASLGTLSALVDKSWLHHNMIDRRYGLHELLRQYAAERLATSGEAEDVRGAHAAYFAGFMRQRESDIKFQRQLAALNEIEADFDNVRAAWYWAAEHGRADLIIQMAEALNFFCDMRARFVEGEEMLRAAAPYFEGRTDPEGRLAYVMCRTRRMRMILLGSVPRQDAMEDELEPLANALDALLDTDLDADLVNAERGFLQYVVSMCILSGIIKGDCIPAVERSLMLYSALNDRFYVAELLVIVGVALEKVNNSRTVYEYAIELQREIGDMNGLSWTLTHMAQIAFFTCRYDEVQAFSSEAQRIQRERGDRKGLCTSIIWESERHFMFGELDEALSAIREAYQLAQELNIRPTIQVVKAELGLILVMMGDFANGERECMESLTMHVKRDFNGGAPALDAFSGLIPVACAAGDLDMACRYYRSLVSIMQKFEAAVDFHFSRFAPCAMLILEAQGDQDSRIKAVELLALATNMPQQPGYPVMCWMETSPVILAMKARLQTALPPDVYDAAWQRGAGRHFAPMAVELGTLWNQAEPFVINGPDPKYMNYAASSDSRVKHAQVERDYALLSDHDARLVYIPSYAQQNGRRDNGGDSRSDTSASTHASADTLASDSLTDREIEVLRLAANGYSNRDIARELVLALGTVKWYLSEIYSKFGVSSRTQAIAHARQADLL